MDVEAVRREYTIVASAVDFMTFDLFAENTRNLTPGNFQEKLS